MSKRRGLSGFLRGKARSAPLGASAGVDAVLQQFKKVFGDSSDLVMRKFLIAEEVPAALVFFEDMVDKQMVARTLEELIDVTDRDGTATLEKRWRSVVERVALTNHSVKETADFDQLYDAVLNGNSVLTVDGEPICWILHAAGFQHRQVSEVRTERSVRGSREGFIEVLSVNLSLIRRRLKDSRLQVRLRKVGKRTRTQVAILFIDDITNREYVETVEARIGAIDADRILESGQLGRYIRDHPYSLFPTIRSTSRPDLCAHWLLEGRVVVLVDNTPFALVAPAVLMDFFQTMEDHTHVFWDTTVIRGIRCPIGLIAPFLPGLYIALTAVHPGLIPRELALSVAGSREGLPFPTVVEVFIMEATMEILREATVRMPAEMGNTIGIVGGLVIGTAASQAGIISNLMVIVVSLTAVATFASPTFEIGIPMRILRWCFAAAAAVLGLYGMTLLLWAVIAHLCRVNSYSVPYLTPFSPLRKYQLLTNTFTYLPDPLVKLRPKWLRPRDQRRQKAYTQPRKGPQVEDGD